MRDGKLQVYVSVLKMQKVNALCTKLPAYQVTLFMKKGYRLYVCSLCVGEIDEEILGNCTEKLTEHTSLNMRTNHQLNVKTSNEELLEHKVRYLEKELAISNRKLPRYKQDETKNSMEEYSDSIGTQNIVLKQQIEDIEAERDALIMKSKTWNNLLVVVPAVLKKYSTKNF